jgi:hypothetical protein
MKQTAVEWLVDELILEGFNVPKVFYDKAKAMEKEQIVNAFEIGYDNGACVQEGNAIYHGSNYYNETFKSE